MKVAKIETGKEAPDFSAKEYSGKELSLSDFKDEKNVFLVLNRGFK
jgi:peroxiredoxin